MCEKNHSGTEDEIMVDISDYANSNPGSVLWLGYLRAKTDCFDLVDSLNRLEHTMSSGMSKEALATVDLVEKSILELNRDLEKLKQGKRMLRNWVVAEELAKEEFGYA